MDVSSGHQMDQRYRLEGGIRVAEMAAGRLIICLRFNVS